MNQVLDTAVPTAFSPKTNTLLTFDYSSTPQFLSIDVKVAVGGDLLNARSVGTIYRTRPVGTRQVLVRLSWASWGGTDIAGSEAYVAALAFATDIAKRVAAYGDEATGEDIAKELARQVNL